MTELKLTHSIIDNYFFYCKFLETTGEKTVPILKLNDTYHILYDRDKGYNINEFKIKFPNDMILNFAHEIYYCVQFKENDKPFILNTIRYKYKVVILGMEDDKLKIICCYDKLYTNNFLSFFTKENMQKSIIHAPISQYMIKTDKKEDIYNYNLLLQEKYKDNTIKLVNKIVQNQSSYEISKKFNIKNIELLYKKLLYHEYTERSEIEHEQYEKFKKLKIDNLIKYEDYLRNKLLLLEYGLITNMLSNEIKQIQRHIYADKYNIMNNLQQSFGIVPMHTSNSTDLIDFDYLSDNSNDQDLSGMQPISDDYDELFNNSDDNFVFIN
jgi:hypothetical protein